MLVSPELMSKTWENTHTNERYKIGALCSLDPHNYNTLKHQQQPPSNQPAIIIYHHVYRYDTLDGVYCALCDQYFFDKRQRAEHIMNANDHPECWRCGRRFLNGQILRRHCVTAPNHHYCVPCDKHCRTAAGFRVHMEQVHSSDDDDSDDDNSEEEDYYDLEDGWEDERGEEEYPDEVSESGDEPLDTSWEDSNEYDFEDPEYLRLPPSFSAATTDDAEESDEEDVEEMSSFSCPMCQKEHTTLYATPCGHVYCVRCIRAALKYTEACPVCDERAIEDQLRKIYISQE